MIYRHAHARLGRVCTDDNATTQEEAKKNTIIYYKCNCVYTVIKVNLDY